MQKQHHPSGQFGPLGKNETQHPSLCVCVCARTGLLFMAYQGMFAVITPVLMTGAFADRFRFKAYLVFLPLWMIVVYAPFCHWVWGGGWMGEWGVWDFAGGIVVHITAGFSALASLAVVGKRSDADDTPHNIPFVALGTALLWFGWFCLNGSESDHESRPPPCEFA